MSDEISFCRVEIDRLEQIVREQRNALVDRMVAEFPDKSAYAMCMALASLFGSAFVDDIERQHEMASATNQVLDRSAAPIGWRMSPLTVRYGQHRRSS